MSTCNKCGGGKSLGYVDNNNDFMQTPAPFYCTCKEESEMTNKIDTGGPTLFPTKRVPHRLLLRLEGQEITLYGERDLSVNGEVNMHHSIADNEKKLTQSVMLIVKQMLKTFKESKRE